VTASERAEIIRLLPCYRMEQLEPDAADRVRRALHEDPSLRELLATITDAERLCAATLRQGAPAGLRSLGPTPEPAVRLGAGWAGVSGLLVALVLAILVRSGQAAIPAAGALAPLEDLLIEARVGGEGLIAASTPTALAQRLQDAGLLPPGAGVTDLGAHGLVLDGAMVQGDLLAVVWRDTDGGVVLGVVGPSLAIHRTADQIHRPDTGTGPVLQGHSLQGHAVVYWDVDGQGCALVAAGGLDALVALAFRAVWSPVG